MLRAKAERWLLCVLLVMLSPLAAIGSVVALLDRARRGDWEVSPDWWVPLP